MIEPFPILKAIRRRNMLWSYCNLLGLVLAQSERGGGRSRGEKNTSVLKSTIVSTQPGERERERTLRQRKKRERGKSRKSG